MLAQHHVPFDNTGHVFMLGAEPGGLAGEHADDADPGLTFWAEPGDQPRLFQVFEWRSFLPVGGAAPIGEARSGPGPGGSCTNCPGSEQELRKRSKAWWPLRGNTTIRFDYVSRSAHG